MAAKSVDGLVNLCHLFMKELGMSEAAVQELLSRASTTGGLESLRSVEFWKLVTQPFHVLEEKIAMGPFKQALSLKRPLLPDLNKPAPENEDLWVLELDPKLINEKAFEGNAMAVEAEGGTAAGKRKLPQSNHSLVKRLKCAEEHVGPANHEKEKSVPGMERVDEN